ncbi:MAG: nuclear transport factor 2 family protein [Pseudonocardia sp.]|nr:nuclear transport factor 2 family protein [Pseudonocardia sp.]
MAGDELAAWRWYDRLVTAAIPWLYRQVSAGRYWVVLALCARTVHTQTPGAGPLGGSRHTRATYRLWWRRVFRLNSALDLRLHSVTVDGPPWDTTVHTEWTDHVTAGDGTVFTNHGSHDGRMRWGRITSLIYHWDDQVVQRACEHQARLGFSEAAAPAIDD